MHLPNGAVTPACAIYGAGIATAMTTFAAFVARKVKLAHPWKLAFATAAVFAAQALNIRLLPTTSGHVVGAFLLAYYFGSAWATLAMTAVLTLQATLYGDGSLATLGLNVFNMAVIPCWIVYPTYKRLEPSPVFERRQGEGLLKVALAAALSVLLPTLALAHQLHTTSIILPHVTVALLEAFATVGTILFVQQAKPFHYVVAGSALLLVAAFGASPYPDAVQLVVNLPPASTLLNYSFLPLLAGAAFLALCLRTITYFANKGTQS